MLSVSTAWQQIDTHTPAMALLLPSPLSLSLFPSPTTPSVVSPAVRCFPTASSSLAIKLSWKGLSHSPLPLQKTTLILTRASSEASGEGPTIPEKKEESLSDEEPKPVSSQQKMYEVRARIRINRKLRREKERRVRLWRQTKKGKQVLAQLKKKKKGKKRNKKRKGKRRVY